MDSPKFKIAPARLALFLLPVLLACSNPPEQGPPHLKWYVFNERSGAFRKAARRCSEQAQGKYMIEMTPLPADADQQREQLVRRLASEDPEIAEHMAWAQWPAAVAGLPSRVTVGGINLAIAAFSRFPALAFEAASCIASEENQRRAAIRGGMPPSAASLYDDPVLREQFPFADILRESLENAVQRPKTPIYADVSLAISHTLHPLSKIDPETGVERLRLAIERALRSEGLF